MKQIMIIVFVFCGVATASASICPYPQGTSLAWGKPPAPWQINPSSLQRPQVDDNTRFLKANILVAGVGQGISCTYENSLGQYSIWWQVRSKIPSRQELYWVATVGGYVCSASLEECVFQAAIE